MLPIRDIESSTQEVCLWLTLVTSISMLAGSGFYLFFEAQELAQMSGVWGVAFFEFLFSSFGYSVIYFALAFFLVGRYLLPRMTCPSAILKEFKNLIGQTFLHLFFVITLSSFLSVLQSFYQFTPHKQLIEGSGGIFGQLIGGNAYNYFGIYGSLALLSSMLIIVGIAAGFIHLVDWSLFLQEQILRLLTAVKHSIYKVIRKLIGWGKKKYHQFLLYLDSNYQFIDFAVAEGSNLEMDSISSNEKDVFTLNGVRFNREASIEQDTKLVDMISKLENQIGELQQKVEKSQVNEKAAQRTKQSIQNLENPDKMVEKQEETEDEIKVESFIGKYIKPDIDLLSKTPKAKVPSQQQIETQCSELEQRLESFQIKGKVIAAHIGPSLTMYEFEPAPGMKLSKITGLTNDLALVLGASSIRVLAPIPGKMTVGIEVPNKQSSPVAFESLLKEVEKRKEMALPIVLGQDVYNQPVISDIASMPHLLVSGTTGSGKSVFINTLISSLLFNKSPKELRFLMVDPKMIELSPYNGIPHLLKPVVTDVVEAKDLLVWAEQEMDRRYQQFSDIGARNIESFNESIKEGNKKTTERRIRRELDWKWQHMPYIVIVIDELADLMITQGKEVEIPITRIAQKARAAGIHLVIATQRPSAEIVTGLIKTNFPTRISFKVSSGIDSRTILDTAGAEKLLGKGDMLFMPNGKSLERVQGAFISEKDVKKIVKTISK